MQAKLDKAQATLNAIMPSQNTFNIHPNQSLVVGDGRLTVGLVGSPSNESVTLDINGKRAVGGRRPGRQRGAGLLDQCQVQVQSFDMFKAVLFASCTGAKPQ